MFCDITHQCFAGKKLKNLNFPASGIYRIYILISYYVRGIQYMPPRVLAFWGQNPAGAETSNENQFTVKIRVYLLLSNLCIHSSLDLSYVTHTFPCWYLASMKSIGK